MLTQDQLMDLNRRMIDVRDAGTVEVIVTDAMGARGPDGFPKNVTINIDGICVLRAFATGKVKVETK
jgi:hypothetical protein